MTVDNIDEQTPQDKALAGALAMAGRGYRVFPCEGKQPRKGFMWKEAATLDAETIKSWPPFMYYGVAFGPGQFATDLDMKAGKDGVSAINNLSAENGGDLPDTFAVRTSSGGYHLYWTGLGSNSVERIADGIDVRAEGGYCIGPGSLDYEIETDNPVAHAPAWILSLVAPKVAEVAHAPEGVVIDDPGNLVRARLRLDATPEAVSGHGGNDRTLKVFNELVRDLGISEKQAVALVEERYNSRCVPPWSHDELVTLAANAGKYGQNEIGAYATAPPSETFAAAILDASPEAIEASPSIAPAEAPEEKPSQRFDLLEPPDFANREVPKWLIDGLIMEKRTHVLFGQSESMKTFMALDLLASVAFNLPAFGKYKVFDPGDTVFFCDEDPDELMRVRYPAWCRARGIIDPFAVSNPGRFVVIPRCPLIIDPEDVAGAIRLIKERGLKPRLIAVDTLAKAMIGLNQDSSKDIGGLYAAMSMLRRHFGCATLLTHHPKKADDNEMRGSGAQTNDADIVWRSERQGQSLNVTWYNHKMKSAPKPKGAFYFAGELFQTGALDQEGKEITAPVFTASDAAPRDNGVIALPDMETNTFRDRVVQFLIKHKMDQHETSGHCIRAEDLAEALCPAPRDGREYDWNENNEYQSILAKLREGARAPRSNKTVHGKTINRSGGFLWDLAKTYPLPGGAKPYIFFAYADALSLAAE